MSAVERTWPTDQTAAGVEFLLVDGRAARLLAQHRPRPDGYCAAHEVTPTRWPCTAARLAGMAVEVLARRLNAPTVPLRAVRPAGPDTTGAA